MTKAHSQPRRDPGRRIRWLRRQVQGLAAGCPILRTNPVNCPLFELRHMDVAGRAAWIGGLTSAELEYLVTYHGACVKVRIETSTRRMTTV
jgi:hypothetical protein